MNDKPKMLRASRRTERELRAIEQELDAEDAMTPTIIDYLSPNHSARDVGVRVDTVLIHHTGTKSNAFGDAVALRTLCDPRKDDPSKRVSAHYLVGEDGRVFRLVPEDRKAWHAGKGRLPWETCKPYDFNHRSVGIEVVNPGDGVTPFTEAQYRALEWLVPDIARRLGIVPIVDSCAKVTTCSGMTHILGHRDVAPGRKTDPADNFDWGRIRQALAGGGA